MNYYPSIIIQIIIVWNKHGPSTHQVIREGPTYKHRYRQWYRASRDGGRSSSSSNRVPAPRPSDETEIPEETSYCSSYSHFYWPPPHPNNTILIMTMILPSFYFICFTPQSLILTNQITTDFWERNKKEECR